MSEVSKPVDVLRFWFGDEYFGDSAKLESPEYSKTRNSIWYGGGAELDAKIRGEFADLIRAAGSGKLVDEEWANIEGKLAKIVLFDQLSRNAFRGTPEAFHFDAAARELSKELIESSAVKDLPKPARQFVLSPLLHSEDLSDLDLLLDEAKKIGMGEGFMSFATSHRDVVARFGRFPHRNKHYGRETTPEEAEWLSSPECPGWARSQ